MESVTDKALVEFEENKIISIEFVPTFEIFYNSSGFGIYDCERLLDKEKLPTFKLKGEFINNLEIGQPYLAKGRVVVYNGIKQLDSFEIQKIKPKGGKALENFLDKVIEVKSFSVMIYEEFGEKSIEMIMNYPEKILELSPAIYLELIKEWQSKIINNKDISEIAKELEKFGIPKKNIKPLFDAFGYSAYEKVKENPYILAEKVSGFSFKKCDKIALEEGFSFNDERRISEGVMHILKQNMYKSNTCMFLKNLLKEVKNLLSIKLTYPEMNNLLSSVKGDSFNYNIYNTNFTLSRDDLINSLKLYDNSRTPYQKNKARMKIYEPDIETLKNAFNLLKIGNRISITKTKDGDTLVFENELLNKEMTIANNILEIVKNKESFQNNIEILLEKYLIENKITLEEKQKEAVLMTAKDHGGFQVIDGSAGCGKTFSLNIALDLLNLQYSRNNEVFEVLVLAPTGKAANVAASATGKKAFTVHRGLEYNPNKGFGYHAQRKLPYDCVVVDESSMMDTHMMYHLMNAISRNTKVIFLGDTKQLPSVGPGNILRDLISSNKVDITTLTVVKRQAGESQILANANHIIKGEMIETNKELGDAYVLNTKDNEVIEKSLKYAKKLIKKYSLNDIQILAPQKMGVAGVNMLNYHLQKTLNSKNDPMAKYNRTFQIVEGNQKKSYSLYFKTGDKVMQMKNNYGLEWYDIIDGKLIKQEDLYGVSNGETGRIIKILKDKIIVKFDDKVIIYDTFGEIDHSYATTIHKSQGSEWKAVIMVITARSLNMLDKNLIYTGYTRAKEVNFTIGDMNIFKKGLTRSYSDQRVTGLKYFL